MNPRLLAINILVQVIAQGKSLNHCSPRINEKIDDVKDRALARELVFGTLRYYHQLSYILNRLLNKPLKEKDFDVTCVLLIGIYQLRYLRIPNHAAVNESVKLTQKLKKKWAKGFANGVLRSCLREADSLTEMIETENEAKYSHPAWMLGKIKKNWPQNWQNIVSQNNQQAPMVLRVNQQEVSVEKYRQKLTEAGVATELMAHANHAILLPRACDVNTLPGFYQGWVSVQDAAAQQAADLLDLSSNCYVLDACAAPGGKTAHILETEPSADVLALDLSEKRLSLVSDTLTRLKLTAKVKCANASAIDEWWDGRQFDRILLDAPCSATGVIRRNPDIKIHRRPEDIDTVVASQKKLLEQLWTVLKPGGILLYATCSILKDENENQVQYFIHSHADAVEVKINADWGSARKVGVQVFPGEHHMDGFYYARIKKNR